MVRVYFTDGNFANVTDATQVEHTMQFWSFMGDTASIVPTLLCKDAKGKELARFLGDDVRGYVIDAG